jgi:tRNA pseudouridine38-40 synthase
MRYRALVEYDGTVYSGFQRQRAEPTIQGEIERALERIRRLTIPIVAAGRTDSGVHATGQVIAFDLSWRHGTGRLLKAINANLPEDIVVHDVKAANADFHPRFDALSRTYTYYIYNQTIRSPIRRQHSWHVARPLDLDLLNEVASSLVGEHDFATFGQAPQGNNTKRCVIQARWQREKQLLILRIEADAFLYRMVRSLVGSMKVVGEGTWTVVDFSDAFLARDRGEAAKTAPAHGLFLTSVSYA